MCLFTHDRHAKPADLGIWGNALCDAIRHECDGQVRIMIKPGRSVQYSVFNCSVFTGHTVQCSLASVFTGHYHQQRLAVLASYYFWSSSLLPTQHYRPG